MLGLLAASCSESNGSEANATAPAATEPVGPTTAPTPAETTSPASVTTAAPQQPPVCATTTPRNCLLPWPNDRFTVADPTTATGRRLALPVDAMPRNADGVPIDVAEQNRADGFSPHSVILVDLPGLDPTASKIAPSTDIGASLADDAPIRITDTVTGERWPYFAELDAQAADDADRLLMIHPAVALTEGHTFEVSIGSLVDSAGEPLTAPTSSWRFTVASAESMSDRLLTMRDDAFASLDGGAPTFRIESVTEAGGIRTIEAVLDVPLYLSGEGTSGATLVLGEDGRPSRNPTTPSLPAAVRCVLPSDPPAPVPMIVYGHGLLGGRGEVDVLSFAASIGVAGACATDWIGMSRDDLGTVAAILGDLSLFPTLPDRLLQAHLNMLFLGRALNDERSFASDPAFRTAAGSSIIAAGSTQFVGNSQGGILGGATSAVSTEWTRALLGVPGINYALLLTRSSNWPQFQLVFDRAYTSPVDRVIALQLIQLLWDRGENSGYAQHLTTDPYPGSEAKQVLLVQAFGDHQVANVSTDILARTIGAAVHRPSLAPGRSLDAQPQWGIPALSDTVDRAAMVVWDFATPAPPTDNRPPNTAEHGRDPHGAPSAEQRVLTQALTFLLTGSLPDVCAGEPCTSDVLAG
jgi:hypothetical protein